MGLDIPKNCFYTIMMGTHGTTMASTIRNSQLILCLGQSVGYNMIHFEAIFPSDLGIFLFEKETIFNILFNIKGYTQNFLIEQFLYTLIIKLRRWVRGDCIDAHKPGAG